MRPERKKEMGRKLQDKLQIVLTALCDLIHSPTPKHEKMMPYKVINLIT